MSIRIFDVEHGACALVETPTNRRILIDCGSNSGTGWRPSTYLARHGVTQIDMLAITNYDEDHAHDLPNLRRQVFIHLLLRNPTVSPYDLKELKSEHGADVGIESLMDMAAAYASPAPEIDWGLSFSWFCNHYPHDFEDENNLSLALFINYGAVRIVFPGDLEKAGWRRLLERADFRAALAQVNVFVASHHGRENGCCPEVFDICKPNLIVMSDKPIQYATQETINWYRQRASGAWVNGEMRRVLTTRRDGRIRIDPIAGSAAIYTSASAWAA